MVPLRTFKLSISQKVIYSGKKGLFLNFENVFHNVLVWVYCGDAMTFTELMDIDLSVGISH